MAEPLNVSVRTDEPRGADLQAQIEEVRRALQDWRRTREYSQPTLERLAQITVQCAAMVDAWQQVGGASDTVAGERIRALERTIEQEWRALRDDRDDAAAAPAALAEGHAADLTLRGLARTESRLATLEQDLKGSIAQLSHDLQAVVTELRSTRPQAMPGGGTPAFPLEGVMRIHEEMRASEPGGAAAEASNKATARALPEWSESAIALTARMESLERVVGSSAAPARPRGWLYVAALLLVTLGTAALFAVWTQRRVDARLNEAADRVTAAERERDSTAAANAATRAEAARQVAAARQSAAQAQIVGNVLAAPDLVRYWLVGAEGPARAYAQVLFSRSRGMVFSASRLPPPAAGKTYQLWLITRGAPVSAGVITPDSAGRVTLATDVPPSVPSRLTGALVTIEAPGGAAKPSAENVLVRVE